MSHVACHVSRVIFYFFNISHMYKYTAVVWSLHGSILYKFVSILSNLWTYLQVLLFFPYVICRMSRVTCHMSHVFFCLFFFDKLVKLIGGGDCYQRGLPRLVSTTLGSDKFHGEGTFNIQHLPYTRRYGPLWGPTSNSCGGLCAFGRDFFSAQKRSYFAVLANFWQFLVSISNLVNC